MDIREELAHAINGPVGPVPATSPYTLEELRAVRFESQTTAQTQRMLRMQAEGVRQLIIEKLLALRRTDDRFYTAQAYAAIDAAVALFELEKKDQ